MMEDKGPRLILSDAAEEISEWGGSSGCIGERFLSVAMGMSYEVCVFTPSFVPTKELFYARLSQEILEIRQLQITAGTHIPPRRSLFFYIAAAKVVNFQACVKLIRAMSAWPEFVRLKEEEELECSF